MLNRELAATAKKNLEDAVATHKGHLEQATTASVALFELRQSSSHGLIADVEAYVNTLAAVPKEFSRAFEEYKIELNLFDRVVHEIEDQIRDTTIKSSAGVGVGVAAGATTAFAAPTAAMAIATTFGTASTGTAISALSGAAATNAALAWLGGGALAAGGGGMTAGSGLLALAGPVGWALAGVAAVGGAAYMTYSNASTAEEADKRRVDVEASIRSLKITKQDVDGLIQVTSQHVDGMRSLFIAVKDAAPDNYTRFDDRRKDMLGSLVNHVYTLGHLLNQKLVVKHAS